MKDDLIRRKAAIDAVKHAWAKGLEPSQYIEIIPSIPAVPLDKLCEMLSEKCYCAPYPNDPTSVECERKTCKDCWKAYLTQWMEEQNA